jgi:Development and cell death domain
MPVYVFRCSNETYQECVNKNVFGSTDIRHLDVKEGDFCVLVNFSTQKCHGVWKATSDAGVKIAHVTWGERFPNQVKVEPVGDIKSIPEVDFTHGVPYVDGNLADDLLRLFANLTTLVSSPSFPPAQGKDLATTNIQNLLRIPLFDASLNTSNWEEFEDYVYYLLRLLGIHDVYAFPKQQQQGRPDGFFKISDFGVLYDCTLLTQDLIVKKSQQITNYVAQVKKGSFEIDIKKSVSFFSKIGQVWIITKGQNRLIKNDNGTLVKEISVQSLIQIYEKRILEKWNEIELADELRRI